MILIKMFRLYMASEGVSCRELGKEIGVSPATISRICNGKMCDAYTMIKLFVWLFDQGEGR